MTVFYVDASSPVRHPKLSALARAVLDRIAGRERGLSPTNPYKTIQEALDQCKEEEDRILLARHANKNISNIRRNSSDD